MPNADFWLRIEVRATEAAVSATFTGRSKSCTLKFRCIPALLMVFGDLLDELFSFVCRLYRLAASGRHIRDAGSRGAVTQTENAPQPFQESKCLRDIDIIPLWRRRAMGTARSGHYGTQAISRLHLPFGAHARICNPLAATASGPRSLIMHVLAPCSRCTSTTSLRSLRSSSHTLRAERVF